MRNAISVMEEELMTVCTREGASEIAIVYARLQSGRPCALVCPFPRLYADHTQPSRPPPAI